jgi:hypothetical protein
VFLLFFVFIGILVIVHMARPRFLRKELSSARFFTRLPQPQKTQSRLRIGAPPVTRSFVLQLLVLLLILAALFESQVSCGGSKSKGLGVWVVVDTSASMTARQDDGTRFNAARREVGRMIDRIREVSGGMEVCCRLSAFDMERREILETRDTASIVGAVKTLEPRPLGTNLELLRGLSASLRDQTDEQCRVTHLVVVSDLPAPEWVSQEKAFRIVWRDVGKKVSNIGFTRVQSQRNPLTGLVRRLDIEVTAYGVAPVGAVVEVTGPDGSSVLNQVISWQEDNTWSGSFVPVVPGRYRMRLAPGGAYRYDDDIAVDVGDEQKIRVDWRLPDRRLLRQLGWVEDKVAPHFVVTSDLPVACEISVLVVGSGYGIEGKGGINEIRDFIEGNPLLADVNFDAVETLEIGGIELPVGFSPVLRGTDGRVWLALKDDPVCPCVYVPGLPTGTDDVLGRFSAAVFFNGLRWLLRERSAAPLFTLTRPGAVEPEGSRLVLHSGEGDTYREEYSVGSIDSVEVVEGPWGREPVWPIFIMSAIILFLIERLLAIFGRHSSSRM